MMPTEKDYAEFLQTRSYVTPHVYFKEGWVLLWLSDGLTRRLHPLEAELVGRNLVEAAKHARH